MIFLATADEFKSLVTSRAMQVLIVSTIGCWLCQLIKFVIYSIKYKEPKWYMLASTGGFPSSHTGFVVSLCVILGMLQWHDHSYLDWSFAVAVVFAIVTVHDAMGVRFQASKHAIILNNMVHDMSEEQREELGFGKKGRLKEELGHKASEVLGGAVVGTAVAIIGFYICVAISG